MFSLSQCSDKRRCLNKDDNKEPAKPQGHQSPIPKQWFLFPYTLPQWESPQIRDFKVLTSYNWMTDMTPTIMIPGRPPSWYPMTSPQPLTRELDAYIHDADTTHYTAYPLQPTIEAILHTHPAYNTRTVDVIACSLTFEHLLRLFYTRNAQPFRILVQAFGNTVFFLPREENLNELVPDLSGYQNSFPDYYTGWERDVRGSKSHHRVLEHEFGGLRCVMRFEANGYFTDLVAERGGAQTDNADGNKGSKGEDGEGPVGNEEFTTLSGYEADGSERLLIVDGGEPIPQRAIFDMEARSVLQCELDQEITDHQKMTRLWARHVHNALVGFHQGRLFRRIQVKNMREEIHEWQQNKMDPIGRFAAMLKKIVAFARENEGRLFQLVHRSGWGLELQGVTYVSPLLPKKLMTRWTRDPNVLALSESHSHGNLYKR